VLVEEGLELFESLELVVLGDLLLLLELLDEFLGLAAPVLVQGRNGDLEDLTIVDRIEAVFRAADGLLQGFENRGVLGLEDDQRRIGNAQSGDLVDRRERPVVGDLDVLEDVDVRPSRPELAKDINHYGLVLHASAKCCEAYQLEQDA
jgi:hypothetical protein